MTIGEKIKLHRKDLGLTQTELGEKLGVKMNAVSKWECGRVDDIPTSKIKALARLFGVAPSYLIDDDRDAVIMAAPALPPRLQALADALEELNEEGQEKLVDYALDLVASGRYIKSYQSSMGKKQA